MGIEAKKKLDSIFRGAIFSTDYYLLIDGYKKRFSKLDLKERFTFYKIMYKDEKKYSKLFDKINKFFRIKKIDKETANVIIDYGREVFKDDKDIDKDQKNNLDDILNFIKSRIRKPSHLRHKQKKDKKVSLFKKEVKELNKDLMKFIQEEKANLLNLNPESKKFIKNVRLPTEALSRGKDHLSKVRIFLLDLDKVIDSIIEKIENQKLKESFLLISASVNNVYEILNPSVRSGVKLINLIDDEKEDINDLTSSLIDFSNMLRNIY